MADIADGSFGIGSLVHDPIQATCTCYGIHGRSSVRTFGGIFMRRIACPSPWFALLVLAATSAHGQNLLTNPTFNGTLVPWQVAPGTVYDSGRSATADGTGSAQGSIAPFTIARTVAECVSGIQPGQLYSFGGKTLIPAGQAAAGSSFILVQWTPAANCIGGVSNSNTASANTSTASTETWVTLQSSDIAPAGTVTALVSGQINTSSTNSTNLQVNFDELFFQVGALPSAPVSAPTLSLPALIALICAMVIALWFALRRGPRQRSLKAAHV